jgi:hypothetical protein
MLETLDFFTYVSLFGAGFLLFCYAVVGQIIAPSVLMLQKPSQPKCSCLKPKILSTF